MNFICDFYSINKPIWGIDYVVNTALGRGQSIVMNRVYFLFGDIRSAYKKLKGKLKFLSPKVFMEVLWEKLWKKFRYGKVTSNLRNTLFSWVSPHCPSHQRSLFCIWKISPVWVELFHLFFYTFILFLFKGRQCNAFFSVLILLPKHHFENRYSLSNLPSIFSSIF